MAEKQAITEQMEVQKEWYKDAKKQTAETLPEFVRHLTEDYKHDYGTICHAVAAAALAGAWAVENSPTGGITGFQASAVMWQFISEWQSYQGKPLRLIDYSELLYPQYAEKFTSISKETWDWAQEEARKLLKGRDGVPSVRAHWEAVAAGEVPFGLTISER